MDAVLSLRRSICICSGPSSSLLCIFLLSLWLPIQLFSCLSSRLFAFKDFSSAVESKRGTSIPIVVSANTAFTFGSRGTSRIILAVVILFVWTTSLTSIICWQRAESRTRNHATELKLRGQSSAFLNIYMIFSCVLAFLNPTWMKSQTRLPCKFANPVDSWHTYVNENFKSASFA